MVRLPLDNYRVVDFGWVAAAPLLGALLADAGAEVIKVESQARWDTSRFTPDNRSRNPNKDPWFHCLNRGKLGITLDLSKSKAIELIRELVIRSDIVIENFSPGVMQRLGLDYKSLMELKPEIIMISMSSCGQYGPFSSITTYGPSLNGLAGVDSMVGYSNEAVLGMQQPFADFNAAIHGLFAVLVALRQRQETGEGDYIDLAQLESLICPIGEAIMEYTMNGRVLGTLGNSHRTMAPHNNYPCKGEDKWVSIAVNTQKEWYNFCQALGNPAWCSDERFADSYRRLKNRSELDRLISQWTREHTDYEVTEILQQAGVAAIPCMDIEERYFDPHFEERELFLNLLDIEKDTFVLTNVPYRMSRTPGKIQRTAPMIGQHNSHVFGNILGLSQGEIARLEEERVIS
jgi:benzylsuccinate CoA-transferase BbsF subunit